MARKSKSRRSKRKASNVGRNIVVVSESDSGRFQQRVNSLMVEGYEIVWSTYRHPKESGYFSVVMGGDFSKMVRKKKREEPESSAILDDATNDDESNDDDD